jgi:hypothetical protein
VGSTGQGDVALGAWLLTLAMAVASCAGPDDAELLSPGDVDETMPLATAHARQPSTIAGTPIEDTPENRAVIGACEKYREAVETRDAETVLRVVSTRYRDDSGTPDPADDLDRLALKQNLETLFASLEAVTYEARYVALRRSGDLVEVDVEYTGSFRIRGRDVTRRDRNVIRLEQRNGETLIVSGL